MGFKWIGAILATVVLGAIGSGLWDAVFKPLLPWLGEGLLDVGTLGLQSLRDSVYVEIARGTFERAGLHTLLMLLSSGSGLLLGLALGAVSVLRSITRARTADQKSALDPVVLRRVLWIGTLFVALFAGFLLVNAVRITYIVRAANHIEQFQRIVAPFITENQRLSLASRVAQIASKDDYEKIINELTTIADMHHLRVPQFDIY